MPGRTVAVRLPIVFPRAISGGTGVAGTGSQLRSSFPPARLPKIEGLTPEPHEPRHIREKLHKSRSEFARMIGVSVATLQNWEQGRRQPEGPARALLVVASKAPKVVAKALAEAARRNA